MIRHALSRSWFRSGWIVLAVAVLLVSSPAVGFAVRPGEASFSAEMAAAQRAVAAMHPDQQIRNPDYLAEKFVSDDFWYYYHYSRDFKTSMKFVQTFRIGGYYYVNARTKHIDKLLQGAVEKGLEQVVILGAGYDSRAYRFQKSLPKVRFFELDHPATSARKQQLVEDIFGKHPDNVVFIAVDFNKQNMTDALRKAGYDPRKITFFVWEGVACYLTNSAVDQTLRFIATQSAPGSALVFDYVPESAVKGKSLKYPGFGRLKFRMALAGEPLLSGLPDNVEAVRKYTNDRGLEVLSNVGSKELTEMYLLGSNGAPDGKPSKYFRILHAQVPAAGTKLAVSGK